MRRHFPGCAWIAILALVLSSASWAGTVEKEFTVDAKANPTKTPLATGLQLKAGQVLDFAPNKEDKWSAANSGKLDYRGRAKVPTMKLCLRVASLNAPISEGVSVTVPGDGELFLYCQNNWGEDAHGAIRVKVTVRDAPPEVVAPNATPREAPSTAPATNAASVPVVREFSVHAKDNATKSPLKTGLSVHRGDVLAFFPNKDDRWKHNKLGPMDYHGGLWAQKGRKGEYMVLRMKLGSFDRPITEGMEIVASSDGELLLYCKDATAGQNEGSIRVTVQLRPGGEAPVSETQVAVADQSKIAPGASQAPRTKVRKPAATYQEPNVAALPISTSGLKTPMDTRHAIADRLTAFVNGELRLDEEEDVTWAARLLGIALKLEPENRPAVLTNAQIKRGGNRAATNPSDVSPDPATTQSAGATPFADALVDWAGQCLALNTRDDKTLAAYLYAIALYVDSSQDEALYQSELLKQANVRTDWSFVGGSEQKSPQGKELGGRGDHIARPEFADRIKPIQRRQSTIKGLMVMEGAGHVVGLATDIIITADPEKGRGAGHTEDVDLHGNAGSQMRTSLGEAQRAVCVRYPKWGASNIAISFEDKYKDKEGGSAGTAFALLLLSVLEGVEIDPQFAVTGDITVDWKVRKVGAIDAKILAAATDKCAYVAIPQENAERVGDLMVLSSEKPLWDVQIMGISDLQQALDLVRKDRSGDAARAMEMFADVQTTLRKSSGTSATAFSSTALAYVRSAAGKARLDEILALAPNHLSAKYLRLLGDGKQPRRLSLGMTIYQVALATEAFHRYVIHGNWGGEAIPKPMIEESVRRLRSLRATGNEEAVPFVVATQELVEAMGKYDGLGRNRGSLTEEELGRRRDAVIRAMEKLRANPESLSKLVREGA